jgi:hypothetical protein
MIIYKRTVRITLDNYVFITEVDISDGTPLVTRVSPAQQLMFKN